MKKLWLSLFFALLGMTLLLGSWYVLHGDIEYPSEIARDFFLLDELAKKGVILIGPSSTTGLFHGPLWTYVNFPAYFVGHGNPVIVGWYWVLLASLSVLSGFFMAKKLFGVPTAYAYTLLSSLYLVFHVRGFYNPDGAMLILPAVFFFFVRYTQAKQLKFLVFHILTLGALIQFQMAVGIPFAMLSFVAVCYYNVKWHTWSHILSYLLLIVLLGNFFIFDLRHHFLITHLTIHFLTSATRDHPNILSMLYQRALYMLTSVEFFRVGNGNKNFYVSLLFVLFLILQWKDKKFTSIYKQFLYFYCGFFLLSNANAGGLLYFYVYPLFLFVFFVFSSFITSRVKVLFVLLFAGIYLTNFLTAISDARVASSSIFGQANTSWLFFHNASQKMFAGPEKKFGYYVYSPDVVGYKEKYALLYETRQSKKHVGYFTKENSTYVFIAPPPSSNPFMKDEWWRVNLLHISSSPSATILFSNGYRIEQYFLTSEEQIVPTEANIDPGLSFR